MTEKKEQPPVKEEDSAKIKGIDDGFDKYVEQMELAKEGAKPEATPKVEKPAIKEEEKATPTEAAAPEAEEPCEGCPPKEDKKPIMVLKHKGKDVPVYTQEQLIELASKGFDYTQKTQAISEKDKKLEEMISTLEGKTDKGSIENFNRVMQSLSEGKNPFDEQVRPSAKVEEKQTNPPPPATKEIDWGEEGEYVDPVIKENISRIYKESTAEKETLKKELNSLKSYVQLIMLKDVGKDMDVALKTSQQKYPIEDIIDSTGVNLTQKEFESNMVTKFQSEMMKPEGKRRTIPQLTSEVVKEIHERQNLQRKSAESSVTANIPKSAEDIEKLYPELSEALKEKLRADLISEREESAPVVRSTRAEVNVGRTKETGVTSLEDALEKMSKKLTTMEA